MEAGVRKVTSKGVTGEPTVNTWAKGRIQVTHSDSLGKKTRTQEKLGKFPAHCSLRGNSRNELHLVRKGLLDSKKRGQIEACLLVQPAIATSLLILQEGGSFLSFLSPLSPAHKEASSLFSYLFPVIRGPSNISHVLYPVIFAPCPLLYKYCSSHQTRQEMFRGKFAKHLHFQLQLWCQVCTPRGIQAYP